MVFNQIAGGYFFAIADSFNLALKRDRLIAAFWERIMCSIIRVSVSFFSAFPLALRWATQ